MDIQSKTVLKDALKKFEGTLIVVSHDREFLQGLTNKVYEFKDQKIKEFLGDIDFYLEQRNVENLREVEKRTVIKASPQVSSGKSYEDQKKYKSLSNKLSKVESEISNLEKQIKRIDTELEINYTETIAQPDFFDKYNAKKKKLDSLMENWELLTEQLETLHK